MMAPARAVGSRINSAMCSLTFAMFSASPSTSGAMLTKNGSSPWARSGIGGGGAKASIADLTAVSLPPFARRASAAAIAVGYQLPCG